MSETTLADVQSEVRNLAENIKNVAEDALKQAKDGAGVSASAKEKALELLNKQGELTNKQKELEARLMEVEQNGASKALKASPMSAGQAVVNSDRYKSFVAGGLSGSFKVELDNAITTTESAGLMWSERDQDVIAMPRRELRIRDLLDSAPIGTDSIDYAKQTVRTNNAAPVAEGATKPTSVYAWEQATANVKTIAHIAPITRQAMDDSLRLQAEVDSEMRYGLALEVENQLLSGDGTGQNLTGLITGATAYAAAFAPTSESAADKIMLAVLQASLSEYPADGVVMHPIDWARIALTKDADGNYILGGPQSGINKVIWGIPVVTTQAIAEDKFLCANFRMAARVYDRMAVEVLISSENKDNFETNMYTMRAEERLGLAVRRPAALIYGDFGNVA